MKDFQKIDWKQFNKPPYYQQWLCRGDTLKLATFGDKGLAEVDDNILLLKDQWDLSNVKGHYLDRIGKLLGEARNGNTDDHYRVLLNLRILLNTNDGSIPSIINAIKYIYSSEVVHIIADYPAGLIILHDGEGTPGLNFNKLLNEIIPAGVSFNTRELFSFTDEFIITEIHRIIVRRKIVEYFGNPIKYNGMIKYDGKTVNAKTGAYGRYNGRFKHDGDLAYNGTGMIPTQYLPTPPFKYSSGIIDIMSIKQKENFVEYHQAYQYFNGSIKYDGKGKYSGRSPYSLSSPKMDININETLSDNEIIEDSFETLSSVVNYENNIKKNTKHNSRIKYNGNYFYSHDFIDKIVMESPEGEATDIAVINEEAFAGMRKHHFFNGAYAYDGKIKYDGMALIPLG